MGVEPGKPPQPSQPAQSQPLRQQVEGEDGEQAGGELRYREGTDGCCATWEYGT